MKIENYGVFPNEIRKLWSFQKIMGFFANEIRKLWGFGKNYGVFNFKILFGKIYKKYPKMENILKNPEKNP